MSIDGIGKRGGARGIGSPDAAGPTAAQKTGKSFQLEAPADVATVRGSSALEDFQAGRIDQNGYLDQKVQAATRHLEGLPPADLAELRELLRDQIASDPGFSELVERATGQKPTGRGE